MQSFFPDVVEILWADFPFSFPFLPSSSSEYFVANQCKNEKVKPHIQRPFLVFYSNPKVLLISFHHFIPNGTNYYDS